MFKPLTMHENIQPKATRIYNQMCQAVILENLKQKILPKTQNSNKNLVAIKKAHSDRSTVKFTTFNRHNDNPQSLSLSKFNAPSQ